MPKAKAKTETSQEETVIDATLVEKLDAWRTEEIQRENSHIIVDLIQYLSDKVYPEHKNTDADKEIKSVRKYILESYPFDDSLGISRNAYDVMNSRISRGGQLVYRKKITIKDDRLRDKKGNAITISKMEDLHNDFINKSKPKIQIVEEKVKVEDTNDIELPPTVEESSLSIGDNKTFTEVSIVDRMVDTSTAYFTSLMCMTSQDIDTLLNDRNFQEFAQENYKPLKHLLQQIISMVEKKNKKVA